MRRARTGTNLEAMEPTPSRTRREQLTTRAIPAFRPTRIR